MNRLDCICYINLLFNVQQFCQTNDLRIQFSIVTLHHVFAHRHHGFSTYLEIESDANPHTLSAEEARRADEKQFAWQADSSVGINRVRKFVEIFMGRPIEIAS